MEIDKRFINSYAQHLHNLGALKLFEEEREHLFADHDLSFEQVDHDYGIMLMIYEIHAVRFQQQIRQGDVVTLHTKIYLPRRAIMSFHQAFLKNQQVAVIGQIDYSAVNSRGRPEVIPAGLVQTLMS